MGPRFASHWGSQASASLTHQQPPGLRMGHTPRVCVLFGHLAHHAAVRARCILWCTTRVGGEGGAIAVGPGLGESPTGCP